MANFCIIPGIEGSVMFRLFFFVLTSLFISSSFAQKTLPADLKDWGKQQRVREMLEYWRQWELAGPDKNVDAAREQGLQQFLSMPRPKYFGQRAQSIPAWQLVAGSQEGTVSGRTTDIAFDPFRPDKVMYLGTSGGGIWKTTDGGEHWVPISNSFGSYAMGAIAVHPTDTGVVFAATGDHFDRGGDGLYKSTDGGMNWERIVAGSKLTKAANQLIINPLNPQTMYYTGGNFLRSHDGGYTWEKILTRNGITHLVIDPTDTNRMYIGGDGTIVRSTDGGSTWTGDLASNIPDKWMSTLAISANPAKIYASIGGTNSEAVGIAVSTDYGDTWTLKDETNYMGGQSWYNNACAASPTNQNLVIVGGIDLWVSGQSGANLIKKTDWTKRRGTNDFCHADIHNLKYSPSGNKLYALTDGGIFVSTSSGNSWVKTLNSDLGTLLFVGADAAPDMSYVIGGTQDNGITRAAEGESTFMFVDGGDGGRTFVAQSDATVVYSTYIGASLKRSDDAGREGKWSGNKIPEDSQLLIEQAPFYMYYDVCESNGAYLALCGYRNVYYSEDGCSSLKQITKTNTLGGSGYYPSAVHVCGADPYYLYVGVGGGTNTYVHYTSDAGMTWNKSTNKIGVVAGFVSDPNNPQRAWAVTAGYGSKQFWLTEDGGATWTSPETNLPNLNMQTIARAPNGDLFIGHGYGIMRSIDNGVTWEPLRDGIPLVDVKKLRVRGKENEWLLAATYGRSIWKINIKDLPRTLGSVVSQDDPNFRIESITPNPAVETVELRYRTSANGTVTITLYDELGREVRTLAKEYTAAGDHTLRASTGDLPAGSYSVVIASGGKAITERLVIAK